METQNIISPCKNYNLQKIIKNWGNKIQQFCLNFGFSSRQNKFQNATKLWFKQNTTTRIFPLTIYPFDNRRLLFHHPPQDHSTTEFCRRRDDRPKLRRACRTVGPAMAPVPDSRRMLRCVAGFLEARERLARRGACFALC